MMKRSELTMTILQVPVDFLLLLLSGISAYALRFSEWAIALKPVAFAITLPQYINLIFPIALVWVVIFALAGLYSTDPNRKLLPDLQKLIF